MKTNEELLQSQRAAEMPVDEAVRILRRLVKDHQIYAVAVHRKRSWRDSQKAMALTEYRLQIDALVKAIDSLEQL